MNATDPADPTGGANPGRAAALLALVSVDRDASTGVEEALAPLVEGLDDRDRRLAFEIALGTTRYRAWLEKVLAGFLRKPLPPKAARAREALLSALFQLGHLDRVPAYAVVSDTVTLVGSSRKSAPYKGLANGVLRNALRGGVEKLRARPGAPWADRYAVPAPVAGWFENMFGAGVAEAFFEHSLSRAPVCVRPRDGAAAPAGATPSPIATGVFRLAGDAVPGDLHRRGDLVIQDEGAALACAIATEGCSPSRILDACAAPGGKAVWLADRFPDAKVVAWEHSAARRAELRANIDRFGLGGRVLVPDSRPAADGSFDLVLVDAPCTGFGTLRRHPEIKNRRGADDAARLSGLQGRLLDDSCGHVAPGGTLAYTVCTVTREEGEEVAGHFGSRHGDFAPSSSGTTPAGSALAGKEGMWRLMPQEFDCDGYFVACWRRSGG